MVTLTEQSLLYSENLTLPSFQEIVMTANMGCAECRQRVSQIVSKMTGIREYTMDVPNKLVTVKGDFGFHNKKVKDDDYYSEISSSSGGCCYPLKFFFRSFRAALLASAIYWKIKHK